MVRRCSPLTVNVERPECKFVGLVAHLSLQKHTCQPFASPAMRPAFKQQSSLLSAPNRLNILHLGRTRSFSVPISSSRSFTHDSDNAKSFHVPCTNDAAMRIADARSNALPVKRGPRPEKIINTLDPKRLNPGCFMDLSGIGFPKVHIVLPDQAPDDYLQLVYRSTGGRPNKSPNPRRVEKFPAGTRGFLYFYAHPQNRLHSQIRFRVTEDSDPASFARGHDLLLDKGYVWYLPVAVVADRASTDALLRLLVHDGFVDSQVISDLRNSNMSRMRVRRSIGSLSEPFVVDFTKCKLAFTVPAERHKRKRHIQFALPQFIFYRPGGWGEKLYDEGSALCRFERSTLPQHAGERVIVIRLLKMLVPPKLVPDPPPMEKRMLPAEGELFYKKRDQVWYRNLDQDNIVARLLRVLYDADDERDADNVVGQ